MSVVECRTWVTGAKQPEVKRARERAVEQIAAAASVSFCEATDLAEAAQQRVASELPPSDLRDLRAFRLIRESTEVLRGLSMSGSRVANRADAELRRLAASLADGIVTPHNSPLNLAVAIVLRDPLLETTE